MDIKSLDSFEKIVYDTQVIRKADVLELVDETDSKSSSIICLTDL